MSGHTPGPWHFLEGEPDHGCCYYFAIGVAKRPGRASVYDKRIAETRDEANARLIAAAPELLAFVERTLDGCYCDDGRGLPECDRCIEIRALLAKVRP